MILIDTHVWFRYLVGSDQLKGATIKAIDEAAKKSQLRISAISVWEMAMLVSKKRIELDGPLKKWTQTALEIPGLSLLPLAPDVSIESCQIPGEFHGDPADRMIVATARIFDATLLTSDSKILAYAKSGFVKACKA